MGFFNAGHMIPKFEVELSSRFCLVDIHAHISEVILPNIYYSC